LSGRDIRYTLFSSNACSSNVAFAVSPENITGQTLHGVTYPTNPTLGWDFVYGMDFCTIVSNSFYGQALFRLTNNSNISGNTCYGSTTQGLLLQGSFKNVVRGNNIREWAAGFYGVQTADLTSGDGVPASQAPPLLSTDNDISDNYIFEATGTKGVIVETGGSLRNRFKDNRTSLLGSAGVVTMRGIGYNLSAGGAATQATSKSTGVTLNKPTGAITMNGAALASATSVGFTLTNNAIEATDVVLASIKSGATADSYTVTVDAVAAGLCRISLRNISAGSLSESVVISFAVIKAVAA
jgi:parallel beta-helix repeat protein